jgi:hypothetical protein
MTNTLTPARVAEMAAKATPGPWRDGETILCAFSEKVSHASLGLIAVVGNADRQITQRYAKHNAAFIAAAPDMAALIATQAAEIERLREAIEPFVDLADHFFGPVVEVCNPHPDNPSRVIVQFATSHLENARQVFIQNRTALEAKP